MKDEGQVVLDLKRGDNNLFRDDNITTIGLSFVFNPRFIFGNFENPEQ